MVLRIAGIAGLSLGLVLAACGDHLTRPDTPPTASGVVGPMSAEIPEEVHGRLTGGGRIRSGAWDVSFAGVVQGPAIDWTYVTWADADEWTAHAPEGHWTVQLHRLPHPELSGKTFQSTRFLDASFAIKRQPTSRCVSRAYFTVAGTLDGEPGWVAWIAVADAGHRAERGARDSFRMALWPPGGHPDAALKALDTSDAFTPDATCLGGQKRDLAAGNLRVDIAY